MRISGLQTLRIRAARAWDYANADRGAAARKASHCRVPDCEAVQYRVAGATGTGAGLTNELAALQWTFVEMIGPAILDCRECRALRLASAAW